MKFGAKIVVLKQKLLKQNRLFLYGYDRMNKAEKFLLIYIPIMLIIDLFGGMTIIGHNKLCAACSGCGCSVQTLGWIGTFLLVFILGLIGVFVYLKMKN